MFWIVLATHVISMVKPFNIASAIFVLNIASLFVENVTLSEGAYLGKGTITVTAFGIALLYWVYLAEHSQRKIEFQVQKKHSGLQH
jgi:hypothetical protein